MDRTAFSPVFIVGTPRSGTTLVRLLLDSHPDLSLAPESAFLFRLAKRAAPYYHNLSSEVSVRRYVRDIAQMPRVRDWFPLQFDPAPLLTELARSGSVQVAEVLDCIYSQYALSRGKTRWGDKTPRNIEFYSEITDLFPTAKFLIIIRDCRDVALSLRDVRFGHISAISSATRWANDARRALALQAAYPTQVQITRYEDLLTKPDETLQTMMEFLALRSDVDLQRLYLNHDDDVTHSKSSLYRQPITAQHVGRWRQKISRRDLAICEQIAGSELRRFGYSVELPSTDITPYTIQLGLLKDKLSRLYNVTYLQNYLGFSRLAARRLLEGCVG